MPSSPERNGFSQLTASILERFQPTVSTRSGSYLRSKNAMAGSRPCAVLNTHEARPAADRADYWRSPTATEDFRPSWLRRPVRRLPPHRPLRRPIPLAQLQAMTKSQHLILVETTSGRGG